MPTPDRPTDVDHPTIKALVHDMRAAGRTELINYAAASYRDDVAWQMCLAWLADPSASEPQLQSRALKAAWGWDVSPEQLARVR